MEEKDNIEEKVLEISRVARTVKGGKRIAFRALVIAGDRAGKVGIGIGKAGDVSFAIRKATTAAKRKMQKIAINEKGTILKEVTSSYNSSTVLLKPAREGSSIIAGGVVRSVCELSGIKNLVTKSLRSNNKINTAKATLQGLIEASGG